MKLVSLDSLAVSPDRQRRPESPAMAPDKIADLADSIEARGLLQPLVIEGSTLRAGERRSKAISLLYAQGIHIRHGDEPIPFGMVPIVAFETLSPVDAFLVELEENEKREPLTWQERASAYAKLHALVSANKTPIEAVKETLSLITQIPIDSPNFPHRLHAPSQTILVGQNLSDPDVAKAKTEREAIKILDRKERIRKDALVTSSTPNLFTGDCRSIMATFPPAFFDCVITDPPYGIDIEVFSTQNTSVHEYDDSYEYWQTLMPEVFAQLGRILKADSHGYMFCALERFAELASFAEAAGFETYSRPLIWDRSPDGRLTTPTKWPRRCFECILYFRRGNRDLYEIRGDVLRHPADRDASNYHGAKKPVELYIDLLQRSTAAGDVFLDPFGGSGVALRAGKKTNRDAWVIELEPQHNGLAESLLKSEII